MPALVIVLLGLVLFLATFLVVLVSPLVGEVVPIGKTVRCQAEQRDVQRRTAKLVGKV